MAAATKLGGGYGEGEIGGREGLAALDMLLPQNEYVPPPSPLAMVSFAEPGGQLTFPLLQLNGSELQQRRPGDGRGDGS